MSNGDLVHLAELIKARNEIDRQIAALIGRPALVGHIGEYIAAAVLGIELEQSATSKAIDGRFTAGRLAGRTVNIKWYGKREGILDLTPNDLPNYYLVLTGPPSAPMSSRGSTRPLVIEAVFLFDAPELLARLRRRSVKLGIATSMHRPLWDEAEVYPAPRSALLRLSDEQRRLLALVQ